MKKTYYAVAVVGLLLLTASGTAIAGVSWHGPWDDDGVFERMVWDVRHYDAHNQKATLEFWGWGVAEYYDKAYVKVVLEYRSEWMQKIKEVGRDEIRQAVDEHGIAKIYDYNGHLIGVRTFTVEERVIDEGMNAGRQYRDFFGNGPGVDRWYGINWNNPADVLKVDYYSLNFDIKGVYEYSLHVVEGIVMDDVDIDHNMLRMIHRIG